MSHLFVQSNLPSTPELVGVSNLTLSPPRTQPRSLFSSLVRVDYGIPNHLCAEWPRTEPQHHKLAQVVRGLYQDGPKTKQLASLRCASNSGDIKVPSSQGWIILARAKKKAGRGVEAEIGRQVTKSTCSILMQRSIKPPLAYDLFFFPPFLSLSYGFPHTVTLCPVSRSQPK